MMSGLAYPNGLVLNAKQDILYVAVTRTLQVIRLPLRSHSSEREVRRVFKAGVFLQLSGGLAGPDGMAMDEGGNLLVAHSGLATVWMFNHLGEPLARIRSCAGIRTTNLAYGGNDRKTLFITESEQGVILRAELAVAGCAMYAHL
jgi:gluconolactonase